MAHISVPGYQAFWTEKRKTFRAESKRLQSQSPDADTQLKQLFKVLCDIEDVSGYTPASVGDSAQWSSIVNAAEENRRSYCKALDGKTLYNALYGTYTVALQELKALLKATATINPSSKPTSTQEEGFTEVRRRKRQNCDTAAQASNKAAPVAASAPADAPSKVATRNYFAPIRPTTMDTDSSGSETTTQETVPAKTCRPPPSY
jgi:hypothetical protein